MSTLTFDKSTRIITVDSPDTEITCQDLYNLVRDWEDELDNFEEPTVIRGAGKEELGGGVKVGITITLLDWYLTFEALPTQCSVTGGNLVRYDSATGYTKAIEPNVPAVIVTASSSATLQEQTDIQQAAFDSRVMIDVINGTPGTEYPQGTRRAPVDNLTDAKVIADARGLDVLCIQGDITFGATDVIDGYVIEGQFPTKTAIMLIAGVSTEGTLFKNANITGTLSGDAWLRDCAVGDLNYIEGNICSCSLIGTIVLSGTTPTRIHDCWDGKPGAGALPVIDMGGSGRGLTLAVYSGDIILRNKTGAGDSVGIDLISGHVTLENTVTAGDIYVRGVGTIEDNSIGATVDTTALLSNTEVTNSVWSALLSSYYSATGSFGQALARILGLSQQNHILDNTTYTDDLMTSARIRLFTPGNVPASGGGSETTGLIATYTVTGDPEAADPNKVEWFKVIES